MASVADDFNRADNVDPGPNWASPYSTTHRFSIVSNQAQANSTGTQVITHNTPMATTDHRVGLRYAAGPGAVGPVARGGAFGASEAASAPYYSLRYNGTVLQLVRKNAGAATFTSIGNAHTVTLAAGDLIEIECIGTAIKGYRNGVEVCTATDSTITTGTTVGIRGSASTANAVDDFAAADVTATPTSVTVTGPPAGLRAGGPTGTLNIQTTGQTTLAGRPGHARATGPASILEVETLIALGGPAQARLGGPAGTLDIASTGAAAVTGQPGHVRLTSPAGTVVLERLLTGRPGALRAAGTAGLVTTAPDPGNLDRILHARRLQPVHPDTGRPYSPELYTSDPDAYTDDRITDLAAGDNDFTLQVITEADVTIPATWVTGPSTTRTLRLHLHGLEPGVVHWPVLTNPDGNDITLDPIYLFA